jgi:ATP/maltotriose-dependent transcriptional regulator MalT
MEKSKKGEEPTGVRDISLGALEALMQGADAQVIFDLLVSNARQLAATGQGQQLIKMAPYMGDESESGLAIRRGFVMLGHLVDLDFDTAEALANQLYEEEKKNPVYDFLEKITNYVFAASAFARGDLTKTLQSIDGALNAPIITSDLGDADKINLIRLRSSVLMLQSDDSALEVQLEGATKIADESNQGDYGIHLMAIKAMLFHEKGEFIKAAELAKSVITSSEVYGYTGVTSAMDCKWVLARCTISFGKIDQAIELLEELKTEAEKSKIYTWYVTAESMILRILTELTRIREALDRSISLRNYITKFPKQYDLSWMADVGELYIRYRLNDLNRAKEIAARTPRIYYVNQIIEAMEAAKGKEFTKEQVMQLSEDSPRKKLWKYLYLSEFPTSKDFSPKQCMRIALEVGELTGARDIFMRQGNHHHNLIFQIANEEPSLFLEELSRDCLKRIKLRNESQLENEESLTSRELQVLKHLATGKSINLIGAELHISQNTMKTHLRNIYRKMGVDGRKTAVLKAQESFLI